MPSSLKKWPVEYSSDQTLHFQKYNDIQEKPAIPFTMWQLDPVQLTIKTHFEPFSQHNYHSIWGSPCLTAEESHPAILPPPISLCTECQHYLFWHLQEKTGKCMWRTEYVKEKEEPFADSRQPKGAQTGKRNAVNIMLLNHRPTLWEQMPTGGHAPDHAWQSDS